MPSARDHHGDGRPSRGRNGLVVAQPRKSGETKGAGGDGRSQDVETGNTKAPLLDKRRRRQHVGNHAVILGAGWTVVFPASAIASTAGLLGQGQNTRPVVTFTRSVACSVAINSDIPKYRSAARTAENNKLIVYPASPSVPCTPLC